MKTVILMLVVLGGVALATLRADFVWFSGDQSRLGADAATQLPGDVGELGDPDAFALNGAGVGTLIQLIRTLDLAPDPVLAGGTGAAGDDTVVAVSYVGRGVGDNGYFQGPSYGTSASANYFIRVWNAPVASLTDWHLLQPDWSFGDLRYGDSEVIAYTWSLSPVSIDFAGPANSNGIGIIAATPVPEPTTIGLFLLGGALAWRRRARA